MLTGLGLWAGLGGVLLATLTIAAWGLQAWRAQGGRIDGLLAVTVALLLLVCLRLSRSVARR